LGILWSVDQPLAGSGLWAPDASKSGGPGALPAMGVSVSGGGAAMTKGRIWLIGVLLVTGGLGWWLWQTEWVEIHQGATPTVAAKRNPYLAADRFLQAQGMAVQSEIGLHSLRRPGQLRSEEQTSELQSREKHLRRLL